MARALKLTFSIIGVLALVAAWYFFAPTQIGGQASYVTISGVSMEPLMHKGDLVILKKRSHYDVGDVVAYRSSDIHEVVLHRIIGRDGQRYVMRGDNAQGPDRQRPVFSNFVGERWIQLNGMGPWLNRLREPKTAALLVGLAVLLAGGSVGASHSRRGRRRKADTSSLPRLGRLTSLSPTLTAGLVACGLLGTLALLLALASFSRATSHQMQVPNLLQEKGLFSYEASAKPGVAYPSGTVKTGQPVFLKLVRELRVAFDYSASPSESLSMNGTSSLLTTITGDGGQWTRRFTLAGEQSFSGPSVHLAGTLDLAYLRSLMTKLQETTGVPIDSFEVTIAPTIKGSALVAGSKLQTNFAPTYKLRLDSNQLAPETQGATGALTDNTPLRTQTQSGTKSEPAHLALKLFKPTVSQTRLLSLLLLGISAGLAILLLASMKLRPALDEPSEIERRFADLLVPIGSVRASWIDPVEVESIEALVQLAERYDRAILHLVDGGLVHHYIVEEENTIYRYVAFENISVGSAAYEAAARAQSAKATAEQGDRPATASQAEADWPNEEW
jgi:signal peptidase I